MSAKPTICYISAASHSGSTLLAMLLNSQPGITTVGELKLSNLGDLRQYRCSCRTPLDECEFWQGIVREVRAADPGFSLDSAGMHLQDAPNRFQRRLLRPLLRGAAGEAARDVLLNLSPGWRNHLGQWKRRNVHLARAVSTVSGDDVIVDSSKHGIRLKYLLDIDDIDVKVVRQVRDGRAVALTYMDAFRFADAKDPTLRGGGMGRQHHRDLSMTEAAREWLRSNEEAAAIQARMPADKVLQVKYEELCTDTAATLRRITEFLGVAFSDAYRQFKDVEHHVVGNGMRLDSSSEVVLDDRWKSELSDADLREFDRVAGDLNRALGYE